MICHIVHYSHPQAPSQISLWGVLLNERVYPVAGEFNSTAEFLKRGRDNAYAVQERALQDQSSESIALEDVELLSPVKNPARVLCQGANYREHMLESGMDPDAKSFNMFFNKSSASICAGSSDILRPAHVQLLDYEVELGLVIGSRTEQEIEITDDNIHQVVAGIVIGNDISARDVQVPQMQFFKGKSYRTFCPVGPILCLLEKEDMHYLHSLDLELKVNDQVRQQDSTENLVFKPAESLSEFTQVSDLDVGDLVMTGTPSGCAMQIPPAPIVKLVQLLPESLKWKFFIKGQKSNGRYLNPGDRLTTTIRSSDGLINLGAQENLIREAS